MTDLATTFRPKQDTAADASQAPAQTDSTMAPTTLITEQQMLFATAAAVALPPVRTRRFSDFMHGVAAKVHAVFASTEKPPARRHYPKRNDFFEDSRMAREMDRL